MVRQFDGGAAIAQLEAEKAMLERDLSDTQLALCDVYERIGGGV